MYNPDTTNTMIGYEAADFPADAVNDQESSETQDSIEVNYSLLTERVFRIGESLAQLRQQELEMEEAY